MNNNKRLIVLAIGLAFSGATANSFAEGPLGDLFNSDPCGSQARDWGRLIGGVVGYYVGKEISDGKDAGKILGVLGGALVGNLIGKDMDRRRCEVYKIAQQHHVDVAFEDIKSSPAAQSSGAFVPPVLDGSQNPSNTGTQTGKLGQVLRWGGLAHFEPNSSELTPAAREYFSQVADQYVSDIQIPAIENESINQQAQMAQNGQPQKIVPLTEGDREKLRQHYNSIQIVLTGHTDDTGGSELNAKLSEKRAQTVAALFKSRGVPEENLYFQGAGETQPIADNRMEEGRAKNRRVEIVEMDSKEKLVEYLRSRKPNIEYYRPRQEDVQIAQNEPAIESTVAFDEIAPAVTEAPEKIAPKKQTTSKQSKQKHPKKGDVNKGNEIAQVETGSAVEGAAPEIKVAAPQAGNKFVEIDFGGIPADKDNGKEIMASFGELVGKQPNLIAKLSSFFVKEAQASPEQIYAVSCLKDSPRYSGEVVSLKTGERLEYKTRDYLPGLYETSWTDAVNGHLVALTHVGVLRDGVAPPNNPELLVYANHAQPGRDAQPDLRGKPIVNVYGGTKGVLYRLFSRDKSNNVVCGDLVFPYAPPFEVKSGKLFYGKGAVVYSAEFRPKMVR